MPLRPGWEPLVGISDVSYADRNFSEWPRLRTINGDMECHISRLHF